MTREELLVDLKAKQKKSFNWLRCDRIVHLEQEIKAGKSICPTCKGASDSGSPCGHCGTGLWSI